MDPRHLELPPDWQRVLSSVLRSDSFRALSTFLDDARRTKTIFPPAHEVFAAFRYTPIDQVKVVLLGQDPYHDDGQAHGLCFSVRAPTPTPPSLRNIFRELHADVGVPVPSHGDLSAWAHQGVLLLNTVLTVEAHAAGSHQGKGWEAFTDEVIRAVSAVRPHVVFCLWGNHARKKTMLIDRARHSVVESAHPSPLSARKFFGTRPFSAINRALRDAGQSPIDWRLP